MSEAFSLSKFFIGFATGQHWGKTIALGMSFCFIVFVAVGVWRGYFKKPDPTTTHEQTAQDIINHYNQPKSTFGCASTRVYEYRHPVNGVKWQK